MRPVARSGVYAFAVEPGLITLTLAPLALGDAGRALLERTGRDRRSGAGGGRSSSATPARASPDASRSCREGGLAIPAVAACRSWCSLSSSDPSTRSTCASSGSTAVRTGSRSRPSPIRSATPSRSPICARAWKPRGSRRGPPTPVRTAGTLRGIEPRSSSAHIVPALAAVNGVRIDRAGAARTYSELTGDPEITVTTVESTDPDWFDLGVIVTIDGRRIPFAPLFTALARRRSQAAAVRRRATSRSPIPRSIGCASCSTRPATLAEWETAPRISRHQTDLWADFEDLADQAEPAVSWRATAEGLRDVERIERDDPCPRHSRADLRPYQQAGFDWLAFLWRHRLGGILADDMGLGKTLQMLALIAHAHADGGERGRSSSSPRRRSCRYWAARRHVSRPGCASRTIDATSAKRGRAVAEVAASADVVVTLLRPRCGSTQHEFGAVEWAGLVLDEAQFVKNRDDEAAPRGPRSARADDVSRSPAPRSRTA